MARFREDWEATYTGKDNSGQTVILEEGMRWRDSSWSAVESEFTAGMEALTRAICAGLGVPMATLVPAGGRNSVQARRQFVSDTLVPLTGRLDSALNAQLLPQVYPGQSDNGRIYLRTLWEDQIAGDLDLMSEVFARATGGPVMSPAEARRMMDLPPLDGTDRLREPAAVPLLGPVVWESDE